MINWSDGTETRRARCYDKQGNDVGKVLWIDQQSGFYCRAVLDANGRFRVSPAGRDVLTEVCVGELTIEWIDEADEPLVATERTP